MTYMQYLLKFLRFNPVPKTIVLDTATVVACQGTKLNVEARIVANQHTVSMIHVHCPLSSIH